MVSGGAFGLKFACLNYDWILVCDPEIQWVFRRKSDGDMGWLQIVGSIKLQVSFAKETY